MSGVSLTITWLDEELEPLWTAPPNAGVPEGNAALQSGPAAEEGPTARHTRGLRRRRRHRASYAAHASRRSSRRGVAARGRSRGSATSTPSRATATTAGAWCAASTPPSRRVPRPLPAVPGRARSWSPPVMLGRTRPEVLRGFCGVRACGPLANHWGTTGPPGAPDWRRLRAFAARITGLGKAEPGTRPWWMRCSRSPKRSRHWWPRRARVQPRRLGRGGSGPPRRRKPPPPCARSRDGPGRSRKRAWARRTRSHVPGNDFPRHGAAPGRVRHPAPPAAAGTTGLSYARGTNAARGHRLVLGADEAGVDYKNRIIEDLRADPRVSEIIDIGVNRSDAPEQFTTPYPYVGIAAGELIRDGHADRAILFCGTGIGVAIAANKVDGIRAATAHDSFWWSARSCPTTARC